MALILVDKSAWARGGPGLADLAGELCMCVVTRLEILYSARSGADYANLAEDLDAFRDLRIGHRTLAAAESAQREPAAAGRHRVPLPELLIGACAQEHGADVVHVERHFDLLAETFGFPEHPPELSDRSQAQVPQTPPTARPATRPRVRVNVGRHAHRPRPRGFYYNTEHWSRSKLGDDEG